MSASNPTSVSIAIGSSMYGRFEDLPNTPSHDIAEFVDNALQASRDKRPDLLALDPDYKLRVIINIDWDETETKSDKRQAVRFFIEDNAGGISIDRFTHAFEPAYTPENNTGLNEFGMGLKTAACWLGKEWTVTTKALGESVERVVHFDLTEVQEKKLDKVPVATNPADVNAHYTRIEIECPTKNAPYERSLSKLKTELASIYRNALRHNEVDIYVNDDPLSFAEYNILKAPFVKDPDGPEIEWKKEINFSFLKYKATGFIALLRDINNQQNGFVLSRRGRVIIGAESDGRYFPKSLSGSPGNFRYKRVFGEIELEGFSVSFNKNDIQDKDNLEMLMQALYSQVQNKDFKMMTQADDYRPDNTAKIVKKLVSKHDQAPKVKREPVVIDTQKVKERVRVEAEKPAISAPVEPEAKVINEYKNLDVYNIGGKLYHLKVQFTEGGPDLCWISTSKEDADTIICNINVKHVFFEHFGEPTEPVIAILKSMVIAKVSAKKKGNDSAPEMMEYFNEFIKKTQV